MKAGTLEIELLMNVAQLQADMENVKKSVGRMSDDVGRKTKAVNDNLAGFGRGVKGVGQSSRLASHHAQNLSFQLQDIAIGLKGGQRPMTVFMQQGSQIAQIMGQAGIGVGGLAKEIAGMAGRLIKAHPILTALAVAAGIAVGALQLFQSQVEKSGELQKYADGLGLTKKEMEKLEGVGITATDVFVGLYRTFDEYLGLSRIFSAVKNFAVDTFKTMLEAGKIAASGIYAAFMGTLDAIAAIYKAIKNLDFDGVGDKIGASFSQRFNEANAGLGKFGSDLRSNIIGAAKDRLSKQAADIIGDRNIKSRKARKDALSEEEKALQRATKAAQDYIKSLEGETSRIGKSAVEIKKMEIAANAAIAPTEELRRQIIAAGKAWEDAYRAQADADFQKNVIGPLQDELALLGLVGPQRELAALALEEQAFKAQMAAQGITDVNKAWEDYLRVRKQIIQGESALERDRQEAELLNDQLRDMIGLLGSLGGVAGGVGALLGIFSGQASAVGGPIGDLLNAQIGSQTDKDGKIIARTIGDEMADIFKPDGEFGKTMSGLLQGAGTGITAASALFGKQSTTEQIGAALGGAAGKVLGTAIAGPLGGAIGSIAGGLLGSVVGGLFTSTKWGRVDLSSAWVGATQGNNSASERAALAAGGSIFSALEDIADAFGGTVGDFGSIAVGVRHGDYRVNANGTSLKKKKGAVDFNDDAEAAIAYAIQIAIERGAIDGIRASTQALLKSSDDLQANLRKALDFEGVFSQLKAETDPLGYALDNLATEFDRLRAIFDEAGASAAEYAQLQELQAIRTQQAIDAAAQQQIADFQEKADLQVRILQLQGREEEALALARKSELMGVKDALKPLQKMIYQLEDARAIIDQFGPLADGLRAFKAELMGGSSAGGFTFLTNQFRSTASAAAGGDAEALGKLSGDATAYLEAAKANASSELEYRRAVGEVLAATDSGIFAADAQVEYAQLQIDAIAANTEVLTGMKDELATYQQRLIDQGEWVQRMFRSWDGGGALRIQNDEDTPVYTSEVAA